MLSASWLHAAKQDTNESLAKYLARVQTAQPVAAVLSTGSIWVDAGRMASLSSDYKAMAAGDLITIVVVQDVTSSNAGAVGTARTLQRSSGITRYRETQSGGGAESAGVAFVRDVVGERRGIVGDQRDHDAVQAVWSRCWRAAIWWWKPSASST